MQRSTTLLQSQCLSFLFSDLLSTSVGSWGSPFSLSGQLAENHAFSRLNFLHLLVSTEANRMSVWRFLRKGTVTKTLVGFLVKEGTSLRVGIVASRVLRWVLEIGGQEKFDSVGGGNFVRFFLERVGRMFAGEVEDEEGAAGNNRNRGASTTTTKQTTTTTATFGTGQIILSNSNEDASFIRHLLTLPHWSTSAWEVLLSCINGSDEVERLSALYVLGNNDCLRIGGVVRVGGSKKLNLVTCLNPGSTCASIRPVGSLAEARAAVVGDDCGGVGGDSNSNSNLNFVRKQNLTAVVLVAVPSVPEKFAREYFDSLRRLFLQTDDRKVSCYSLKGLIAGFDAGEIMMEMFMAENDGFFVEVFKRALNESNGDGNGNGYDDSESESENESSSNGVELLANSIRCRLLEERLVPESLTSSITIASASGSNYANFHNSPNNDNDNNYNNGEPLLYKIVLKEGAVVRTGFNIDVSDRVGVLALGTTVVVHESVAIIEENEVEPILRLRVSVDGATNNGGGVNGWISDRLRGAERSVVCEKVWRATSEGVEEIVIVGGEGGQEKDDDDDDDYDDVIDWDKFPKGGVKHVLHEFKLIHIHPRELFPDSPGWECDHCGMMFSNDVGGGKACVSKDHNWVLCKMCFVGDEEAVRMVIEGGGEEEEEKEEEEEEEDVDVDVDVVEEEEVEDLEEDMEEEENFQPVLNIINATNDLLTRMNIPRRVETEFEAETFDNSQLLPRLTTTIASITEMGYPAELAGRSVRAALYAVRQERGENGLLGVAVWAEILNVAIDFLVSGGVPAGFERADAWEPAGGGGGGGGGGRTTMNFNRSEFDF